MGEKQERLEGMFGSFDLDALGEAEQGVLAVVGEGATTGSTGNWTEAANAMEAPAPEAAQPSPPRWAPRWKLLRSVTGSPDGAAAPAKRVASSTSPASAPARESAAARAPVAAWVAQATAATASPAPAQPEGAGGRTKTKAEIDMADLPPVLTVDELAVVLRVERKSAYALVAHGEIPGVRRVGRTIRISRDAVVDWLRQGGGTRRRR